MATNSQQRLVSKQGGANSNGSAISHVFLKKPQDLELVDHNDVVLCLRRPVLSSVLPQAPNMSVMLC